MTTETRMAVRDAIALQVFGEERLEIIKEQIGRGWKQPPTDAELAFIATVCERVRLDPLSKPPLIYFIKRYDSKLQREVMTPQVSVDGLRLMASRSREYLGQTPYQWCGDDGVWRDVWLEKEPPRAARVGIYRRGMREPTYSVALWDEWVQMQDEWTWDERQKKNVKTGNKVVAPFWESKPAHMLAKTAEGMGLKRSIPGETNELELAHLEELHRLEVPARAAEYARIYGTDEDHAFAELPAGAGAPSYAAPRERADLEDLPREERQLPPPAEQIPATDAARARRGDLLEMYSTLLSTARRDGVVNDAAPWVLRSDTPDTEIIAKGRELRALVNQATVARASQTKVEMVDVRSPLYERMGELLEEAGQLLTPDSFDDLRVAEWPAPEEEVQRKIGKLTERLDDEKRRLTDGIPF